MNKIGQCPEVNVSRETAKKDGMFDCLTGSTKPGKIKTTVDNQFPQSPDNNRMLLLLLS